MNDDGTWPQALITWTDWNRAEEPAALLARRLDHHASGRWWFIRKHPQWRLRYTAPLTRDHLDAALQDLRDRGAVASWNHAIYEPEESAFGGAQAMPTAHTLFCADSAHILAHLDARRTSGAGELLGRREQAVVTATALLRGAGLDHYEQGDVWARAAAMRTGRTTAPPPPAEARDGMRRLLTADHRALIRRGLFDPGWADALADAGGELADLARTGHLERGLRAVLAHHLLFHFNRLGLTRSDQYNLTRLAKDAVMNDRPESDETDRLRTALVDTLTRNGTITDPAVEQAMRTVPRHLFVPGTDSSRAYADDTVHTKRAPDGTSLSCASQPRIVAMMLHQLRARPGHRVLELGAGTGYNAALLHRLVAPTGHVTTVDVDTDLVEAARAHLRSAGIEEVQAVTADGALGHPQGAPYDRIIAAVGAHDIPRAWFDQLAHGGRAVTPVRIAGDVSRSIAWEAHEHGTWRSADSQMCTFMPLRGGVGDDPRRIVDLTGDGAVALQLNQDQPQEIADLPGILKEPRHQVWSGVHLAKGESMEWAWLWLACALPGSLSRMPVRPEAVEAGLVEPALPWGSMATATGRGLAYLTLRPTGSGHELGVAAHGPGAEELAEEAIEQITAWDRGHRRSGVHFTYHPQGTQAPASGPGRFVLPRASGTLAVIWS